MWYHMWSPCLIVPYRLINPGYATDTCTTSLKVGRLYPKLILYHLVPVPLKKLLFAPYELFQQESHLVLSLAYLDQVADAKYKCNL